MLSLRPVHKSLTYAINFIIKKASWRDIIECVKKNEIGERYMPSRLSIKHIRTQKKRRPILARAALIISIPAILLLVIGILSFNKANDMMRQPAEPLLNISSNVMPNYQLASFRSLDEQSSLSGWLFLADGPP